LEGRCEKPMKGLNGLIKKNFDSEEANPAGVTCKWCMENVGAPFLTLPPALPFF